MASTGNSPKGDSACDAEVACAILGDEELRTVGPDADVLNPVRGLRFFRPIPAGPSQEEKRINPRRDDLVAPV
jgi:hypothetical protein